MRLYFFTLNPDGIMPGSKVKHVSTMEEIALWSKLVSEGNAMPSACCSNSDDCLQSDDENYSNHFRSYGMFTLFVVSSLAYPNVMRPFCLC